MNIGERNKLRDRYQPGEDLSYVDTQKRIEAKLRKMKEDKMREADALSQRSIDNKHLFDQISEHSDESSKAKEEGELEVVQEEPTEA